MMKTVILAGCLLAVVITSAAQERVVPELTGPYLGLKPPGITPEVFALGVGSRDGIQMKLTMSAGGAWILYTERDPATNAVPFVSRFVARDSWGDPVRLGLPVNTADPADIDAHPAFGPGVRGTRMFKARLEESESKT